MTREPTGLVSLASAVALTWLCLGVACEETPDHAGLDAEAGVARDGSVTPDADAAMPADSAPPDAGEPPVGVPYDFCDEPFFKLHFGGPDEGVSKYMGLWAGNLAYARGPRWPSYQWNLYVLDLEQCLEYQLTHGARASGVSIHDREILWNENREYSPAPNYHCLDLYSYDLETWTARKLTDDPLCEWMPQTNGRYLLYERNIAQEDGSAREILLWDRQEGTEVQIAEPGAMAGNHEISDRYVVWSGYPELAGSQGKDVYYRDLVTDEDVHIPNSADYFCYEVSVWGEYLTYICSEYWLQSWYHIFLHHIPTGEELHLDGEGKDTRILGGAIHAHLVIWNTTQFMSTIGTWEANSDAVIHDIKTGVLRRLTSAPSTLAGIRIYYPYVVFSRPMADDVREYYVGNLEALGVVDPTGHLIPGDPVIDPPQ